MSRSMTWYPESFADGVAMSDMRTRPDPSTGYPGRTYRFYTGDVVYPFGDGLSYNDYTLHLVEAPKLVSIPLEEGHARYSKRCKSVEAVGSRCKNVAFDIHLRVHNPGRMAGSHTVFLFSTPPSVHNSPQKHRIGFEKIYLGPKGGGSHRGRRMGGRPDAFVDEDVSHGRLHGSSRGRSSWEATGGGRSDVAVEADRGRPSDVVGARP